jgi:UrcA family protein
MKTTLALVAALGLALPAMPAAAAETVSQQVVYSDLDLDSAAGQAHLDRRIDRAAREVCGVNEIVTGTRLVSPEIRACVERAKARALERVSIISRQDAKGG